MYSLETFKILFTFTAHKSEIICLEFSRGKRLLLASGARDRKIHLYDASKMGSVDGPLLMQTLEEHTSTITSIKFTSTDKLLSSGSDKLILRSLQKVVFFATLSVSF